MTVFLLFSMHTLVSSLSCSHIIVIVKGASYVYSCSFISLFRQYGALFSLWPAWWGASWTSRHRCLTFCFLMMHDFVKYIGSKRLNLKDPLRKIIKMHFIVLSFANRYVSSHFLDNGFWDTFRTVYPLLSLIYPDHLGNIVQGRQNIFHVCVFWFFGLFNVSFVCFSNIF